MFSSNSRITLETNYHFKNIVVLTNCQLPVKISSQFLVPNFTVMIVDFVSWCHIGCASEIKIGERINETEQDLLH